ncbi:MAG: 3-oxoacyl-ACP reductase FabG [Pseudomonadota bacterium]|nr:3-oxoacyl-ACP reductase FabG [Pseudomonadota bacterium]
MNDKKIALISGANRGIGKAILCEFGKSNYTVIGTSRSDDGVGNINKTIKEIGANGQGYVLDVKSSDSISKLNESIKSKFGVVSVLVNNAGINKDNLLIRMSEDEWTEVLETNLTSLYKMSKEFLKDMMKNRYGRIINIGSIVGLMGNAGQTNYASTKAALIGFTKSLAREVASRNITVNSVSPGFIDTDMTKKMPEKHKEKLLESIPLARIGDPKELAAVINFLASDNSSYITGENINVNGGLYM